MPLPLKIPPILHLLIALSPQFFGVSCYPWISKFYEPSHCFAGVVSDDGLGGLHAFQRPVACVESVWMIFLLGIFRKKTA